MGSIADVNVILPLLVGAHPAHAAALAWFDEQPAGSVGWHLLTRLGVLRLLCNSRVMAADVLAPDAALDVWDRLVVNRRFVEIARLPAAHESALRRLVAGRAPTPNLWTDAWLAALAQCLGREFVTFDRGFRSFAGVPTRILG